MKQCMRGIVGVATAFCVLCSAMIPVTAAEEKKEDWTYENSLLITLKPEQVEAGKWLTPSDFPEADISQLFIRGKENDFAQNYIAVLRTDGGQTIEQAMEKLADNERVAYVNRDKAHPHKGWIKLDQQELTLNVGETATINCIDYDIGYTPGFQLNQVNFLPKNTEGMERYTPDDLPQYPFTQINIDILCGGAFGDEQNAVAFHSASGANLVGRIDSNEWTYCDLVRLLDQMARDEEMNTVYTDIYPTGWRMNYAYSVSDGCVLDIDFQTGHFGDGTGSELPLPITITARRPGNSVFTLIGDNNLTMSCIVKVSGDNIPGDVNGDMLCGSLDALWVLQSVAGTRSLYPMEKSAADMNGDEKITAFDALVILEKVAGLDRQFPE